MRNRCRSSASSGRRGTADSIGRALPVVYVPVPPRAGTIVMLRDSDPAPLGPAIRSALQSADPVVAPSDVRLMDERISGSYAVQRFTASLLGVFAAVAAFLGAVGLYGVVSFAVGRRTREIGIRRALGAQRIEIAGLVLRQAFRTGGGRRRSSDSRAPSDSRACSRVFCSRSARPTPRRSSSFQSRMMIVARRRLSRARETRRQAGSGRGAARRVSDQ